MAWIKNINRRKKYYTETSLEAPSKLLLKAVSYSRGKLALDLGCGAGADTKELARRGFKVTAVDVNEEVKDFFRKEDLKNIKIVIQPIENFAFKHYDLIYAKSSLVFLSPRKFYPTVEKIKNALNQNGVFAARLWGISDSGNKSGRNFKYTFITKEKIDKIFKGFKILFYKETEKEREDALGRMKHWHFLDIIVQNV